MTLPSERKAENIKLSVNKFIKDKIAVGQSLVGLTFNFQDSAFSADDPLSEQWVDVKPIQEMAGMKGSYLLQFDIYTRERSDPFRQEADKIADKICGVFNVTSFKLYSFTDPVTLCDTGRYLIPINSDGQVGVREDSIWMDSVDGIARKVLRFRFKRLADLSGVQYRAS